MQKLIQPINNAVISASFKNEAYKKKFGYDHYGVDMYGDSQAWCQGYGIVVATGSDTTYGNFVVIVYPDVEVVETVIAMYAHLASIGSTIKNGAFVTKDSKLGIVGKTGNATGVHLHVEMRLFEPDSKRMVSAFTTPNFVGNKTVSWLNPLNYMYCKTNSPDNQTRRFADHTYTNLTDRNGIRYTTTI